MNPVAFFFHSAKEYRASGEIDAIDVAEPVHVGLILLGQNAAQKANEIV
jgi:hypothetical protein